MTVSISAGNYSCNYIHIVEIYLELNPGLLKTTVRKEIKKLCILYFHPKNFNFRVFTVNTYDFCMRHLTLYIFFAFCNKDLLRIHKKVFLVIEHTTIDKYTLKPFK